MNEFIIKSKLIQKLGICGDEAKYSMDEKILDRSYKSFYAYQVAEAMRFADAGEMRCERCFYSLGGHGSRGLKCFCPKLPAHFVEKDFFCGHFQERGKNT